MVIPFRQMICDVIARVSIYTPCDATRRMTRFHIAVAVAGVDRCRLDHRDVTCPSSAGLYPLREVAIRTY